MFGAINKLGVLVLNKEVILGIDLYAKTYTRWWNAAEATNMVLLLSTRVLLLIKAARAVVNLITL